MGRPKIIKFNDFNENEAVDAALSIIKAEKSGTIDTLAARISKRVSLDDADKVSFTSIVRAAYNILSERGRVTIENDTVTIIPGKRGRKAKATEQAQAQAHS